MFSPCLSLSLLRWCRMTPKHGWKCFALRFANSFSGLPSVIFHRFWFSSASASTSASSYVCHIDNNCERFNIVKLLCLVTWGQTPRVAEQADWQRFVRDFCIFRSLNTLHLRGMSSKVYKARIYFEQTGRWAGQDLAQGDSISTVLSMLWQLERLRKLQVWSFEWRYQIDKKNW